MSFSPDGKLVLSGSWDNLSENWDNTIKLWDIFTVPEIQTFKGHTDRVNFASFSPDGKHILSGSDDGTIRLWDISTSKEIARFISFNDGEWLAITPDGFYNASPNGDKYLHIKAGNEIRSIDGYRDFLLKPGILEARLAVRPDPVEPRPSASR